MMPNGNPAPELEHLSMVRVTHLVGRGVAADPIRRVQSYYIDGAHVFTVDPSIDAADDARKLGGGEHG